MAAKTVLSRREFVKDTGGLLIGFSLAEGALLPQVLSAATESGPAPSPNRLEAWLHIDRDGSVHVFTGKAEIGMGVETGLTQIVAEELDVPFSRVVFVMGDTSTTADQGGVGGSTSIAMGSKPLRNVAATARALLVRLAAKNLGASSEELQVREGVVSV
jgi:CO/xanthine dehydrogenase Mo-binding subunit